MSSLAVIAVALASVVNLPESAFSVEFDKPMVCSSTTVAPPGFATRWHRCEYVNDKTGVVFSAEHYRLLKGGASDKDLLLSAAQGAAGNADAKLDAEQFSTLNGHVVLEATFVPLHGRLVSFARYVLVKDVMLMLTAEGFRQLERPTQVSNFFASLRIPEIAIKPKVMKKTH